MKGMRVSGYWVVVLAITLTAMIFAYFYGANVDASPVHRIMTVFMCGVALLVLRAPLAAAWRLVASHSPNREPDRYKRDPAAREVAGDAPVDITAERYLGLSSSLQHVHGWRWRYRQPWLLISGEKDMVDALVPGLSASGWHVSPDAVLLYAEGTGKRATDWLLRIRRARRRRPVDAVIQIVRASNAAQTPFDASAVLHQLLQNNRTLGWAAPAYVLNMIDVDGATPDASEAVASTWSTRAVEPAQVRRSLTSLSRRLADRSVQRLALHREDSYLAQLSRHVTKRADALSELVRHLNKERAKHTAVFGLLFAPLFRSSHGDTVAADAHTHERARLTWQAVAEHSRRIHGRRIGFSFSTAAACLVTGLVVVWIVGTVLSGFTNRATILSASDTATKLTHATTIAPRPPSTSTLSKSNSTRSKSVSATAPRGIPASA